MVYMPHWPKILEFKPSSFELDRISELLGRLGNPERRMPPVIHVAGTNGKGSTVAFLAHIFRAAGLRTHVYTSPHLIEFNERIVLNGEKISDSYLFEVLEECRNAAEGINVTFFEATTAAAFWAFSQVAADLLVVETGMGGRLDATNVVMPILSVITSISLEHVESLGSTVELIAGEKSGILKEGVSCVVAPQDQASIMRTIEYHAVKKQAILYRGGVEWFCEKNEKGMVFRSSYAEYQFPLPSLIGDHQIINAGNAIAACSILSGKFNYDIKHEDIVKGLTNTKWPARLEMITRGALYKMLPKNWKLFLDGAHNPSGAKMLSRWARATTDKELYLIVGMTKDKDTEAFLMQLKECIKFLCTVNVKAEPRAQSSEELFEIATKLAIPASAEDSIQSAVQKILSIGDPGSQSTILVCGSLFLAGDLLKESA